MNRLLSLGFRCCLPGILFTPHVLHTHKSSSQVCTLQVRSTFAYVAITYIEEIPLHDVRLSNYLQMRTLHFDPSPSMLEHSSRKEPLSESVDVVAENERAASNQDACAVSGVRCIGPSGISCATRLCYCNPRFPLLHERASLSNSVFEE